MQFDVARLIHAVDVAETSCDGEVWADGRQCLVDVVDILWLRVERVVVDVFVIDAIFFATSDTNFLVTQ